MSLTDTLRTLRSRVTRLWHCNRSTRGRPRRLRLSSSERKTAAGSSGDGALALRGGAADEQAAHVAAAEAEGADAESRPSERAIVHASVTSGGGSYNDGHERALEVGLRPGSAGGARARAAGARPLRRGAPGPARPRHRAAVLRRPLEQQGAGRVRLSAVRTAALPVDDQVRVGHRLAVVLRAVRRRPPHAPARPLVRHGARRDPLPALRRSPRARVPRRATADRSSLLPQLRLAEVLHGGRARARRARVSSYKSRSARGWPGPCVCGGAGGAP